VFGTCGVAGRGGEGGVLTLGQLYCKDVAPTSFSPSLHQSCMETLQCVTIADPGISRQRPMTALRPIPPPYESPRQATHPCRTQHSNIDQQRDMGLPFPNSTFKDLPEDAMTPSFPPSLFPHPILMGSPSGRVLQQSMDTETDLLEVVSLTPHHHHHYHALLFKPPGLCRSQWRPRRTCWRT